MSGYSVGAHSISNVLDHAIVLERGKLLKQMEGGLGGSSKEAQLESIKSHLDTQLGVQACLVNIHCENHVLCSAYLGPGIKRTFEYCFYSVFSRQNAIKIALFNFRFFL